MENFVRDYGTGNALPDPPAFINYANPDAVPASASRPTSRPANFVRQTTRSATSRQASVPPPEEETSAAPAVNMAGVGSKNMNMEPALGRAMSQSRARSSQINGSGPPGPQLPLPSSYGNGPATELVIGDQAYPVDPTHDPQTTRPQPSSAGSNVGKEDDPLARQMKELRNGSVRRNSILQNNNDSGHMRKDSTVLTPPEPSRKDYRNSAEMVVGAYPSASSRPVSPSQPTAAMMKPLQNPAAEGLSVEGVLADYPQKLPGERATHSRSNSRQSQIGASGGQARNIERPVSRDGFAGIGSQGRSPSPSFSGSRGTSPVPPRQGSVSRVPPPSASNSVSVPMSSTPNRVTTPNSVGIALDPSGKVAVDTLAETYAHQQPQPPVPTQAPQPTYHQPPPPANNFANRRMSIGNGNAVGSQGMHLPPQHQPPYGAPPPAPYGNPPYMQPPSQAPPPPSGYANVPPPQHYAQPPQHEYQQPPAHPYAAQPPPQAGLTRGQSISSGPGGYYGGPPQGQPQGPPPGQHINGYGRPPSPQQQMHNQPVATAATGAGVSAAPTGQYTENGTPVLFYGAFFHAFHISYNLIASCSQSVVRLYRLNRGGIRLPIRRHHRCYFYTRRRLVERRTPR